MNIFLYLCIKFILIYHCVCFESDGNDEIGCDNESSVIESHEPLILINDGKNAFQNYLFYSNIKDVVPNVKIIRELCPGGVNGTIKALHLYPNSDIVHLSVNDFFKFNYNFIKNNGLNYAGETGDSIDTFDSYVIDVKDTSRNSKILNIANQTLRYVKLFSSRGKIDPIVYDYIYRFESDSSLSIYTVERHIVLICLDEDDNFKDQIMKLINSTGLIFKIADNCKDDLQKFEHEIFAVLAYEPFEMDAEFTFPIVLCSNLRSHLKTSPYKFVTLTSSDPDEVFKKALIRFMKKVEWQRIAILSDNYDHSLEFERNSLSLFDKEDVLYAVFRIEENINGDYNFFEVLNRLKDADARVVLLNIHEKNVKKLSELVKHNRHYNFVWVLRDQLGDTVTQNMGIVLSINFSPASSDKRISARIDSLRETTVNKIKIKSILEGVTRIQSAYNVYVMVKDEDSLLQKYRQIDDFLIERTDRKTLVYVTYKVIYKDPVLLATMYFDDLTIKREEFTPSEQVPADMMDCELRSNNYFKPCNYFEMIYLMFVLIVFLTTFFTVVIFFSDKNIIHGRRHYRNL